MFRAAVILAIGTGATYGAVMYMGAIPAIAAGSATLALAYLCAGGKGANKKASKPENLIALDATKKIPFKLSKKIV